VENYFNLLFTEIEDHYLRRRGGCACSPQPWTGHSSATWKDAGLPLEVRAARLDAALISPTPIVLRKCLKDYRLAYLFQAVLAAAEDMKEAAVCALETPIEG